MYERFTDRARKVCALANQQAQRYNHEYIGTEHLLLGIVQESKESRSGHGGIAGNALHALGVDLSDIKEQIDRIVTPGPEAVTMGKLPQTPRAKKVIEYAIEEARNLNHNYVGTEHLLLGVIRESDGVGAQVLMNVGVTVDKAREAILRILKGADKETSEEVGKIVSAVLSYRGKHESKRGESIRHGQLHEWLDQAVTLSEESGLDIVAAFAQVVADNRS